MARMFHGACIILMDDLRMKDNQMYISSCNQQRDEKVLLRNMRRKWLRHTKLSEWAPRGSGIEVISRLSFDDDGKCRCSKRPGQWIATILTTQINIKFGEQPLAVEMEGKEFIPIYYASQVRSLTLKQEDGNIIPVTSNAKPSIDYRSTAKWTSATETKLRPQ